MTVTAIVDKMTSLSVANLVPRRTNVYWATSDDANEDPMDIFAAVNGGSYDLRGVWTFGNNSDQKFFLATVNVELRQPDTSRFEWAVTLQFVTYLVSSQKDLDPVTDMTPEPTP